MRKQYTFRPKRNQRFFFGKTGFVDKVLEIILMGLEGSELLNGEGITLMLECKEYHGTGVVNCADFRFETRFVSGRVYAYFWSPSSTSGQIEKVVLKIRKVKKLKVKFT